MAEECNDSGVVTYLAALLLFFISFSLGCTQKWEDFRMVVKEQKRGVMIGWISQFGFMPLFAYAVARAFEYDTMLAIGFIICGCAPGGSTSNLLTSLVHGNVALSMAMSAASTLCASFMVPLLMLIYIDSTYSTNDIQIDYRALFITLAIVVLPACVGMSLRNSSRGSQQLGRYPLWQWCEKIGSVLGAVMLVAVFVYVFVTQPDFTDQRADVWVPALFFQPIGCLVGYGLALLAKLDLPSRQAVCLETGVKNFSFVIAVLALSFSDDCDRQERALVFPYILSLCWVINSVWICGAMRYYTDTVSVSPPATDDSDKGAAARADSSEKDPTSPRSDQPDFLPGVLQVSVI